MVIGTTYLCFLSGYPEEGPFFFSKKKKKKKKTKECCEKYKKGKRCKDCPLR